MTTWLPPHSYQQLCSACRIKQLDVKVTVLQTVQKLFQYEWVPCLLVVDWVAVAKRKMAFLAQKK